MNENVITIEANISAPINVVWDCWVEPKHIIQWNFASDDWHCPSATNDVRVGGHCKSRMEAKDQSFGFDLEYVYNEVEEHKLLSYTLLDGRKVKTTFTIEGNNTRVVTVFEPETTNPAEMQKAGWGQILNSFKRHTEAQN
jgi:uncharacterized protein YndB with AHSA1/START domain